MESGLVTGRHMWRGGDTGHTDPGRPRHSRRDRPSAYSLTSSVAHMWHGLEHRPQRGGGQLAWHGRITKMGRRDLRRSMVEAAQSATRCHDHWKAEYNHLCKRTDKKKAKVAIARKLLVTVWHVLTDAEADRYANPQQVANAYFALGHKLGAEKRGMSATQYTRQQLDRLGIGQEVSHIPWGPKQFKLPPSKLAEAD